MTTYEKIVKGATKVKVAAPKLKYIEPILLATLAHHPTEAENFTTVMRSLQHRLQDSAWSVVYKSLIVIHIMIREGDKDFTLRYIGERMPGLLNLNQSSVSRGSGYNSDVKLTLKYAKYLQTRVQQFQATKIDYVRDERSSNLTDHVGRLRDLSVEKGLLRECESVQKQIDALLKNNFMENDVNNDVVLTSFRLLVNDLLALFQELNEGVINLLEHYFEMFKYDAERALKIYKKFVDQTKYVIDYLRVAKHLEYATKLHVPTIKHAPTALTSSLEEYLDDPNFETNRRQYLYEKNTKDGDSKQPSSINAQARSPPKPQIQPQPEPQPQPQIQQVQQFQSTGLQRNPSLVVQPSSYNPWEQAINQPFFNGQQQQQAQPQPQPQQQLHSSHTGGVFAMPSITQGQPFQQQMPQQQFQQPFQQPQQEPQAINPAFTGSGFGGYGPQQPQQPQTTGSNPFLQNGIQPQATQPTPFSQSFAPQQQQQPMSQQNTQSFGLQRSNTNPFSSMTSNSLSRSNTLQPSATGSANPFANSRFASGSGTTALSFNHTSNGQSNEPQPLKSSSTGSNPFKVSESTSNLFNKANDGSKAQQLRPQATAGGLENMSTIAVFPETQQEQQRQNYLNNAKASIQPQSTQQFQQMPQQMTNSFQPQMTNSFQPQMTNSFQPQMTQQFPQMTQQFPQMTQQLPQQMPQQTAQPQFQGQPQQSFSTYDGPSLI